MDAGPCSWATGAYREHCFCAISDEDQRKPKLDPARTQVRPARPAFSRFKVLKCIEKCG